jgi:hypothetical protein
MVHSSRNAGEILRDNLDVNFFKVVIPDHENG